MTIKFTTNEIRYIALFESMTGAMVKDCIVDDENGKVTFLVKKGDMGLAIGKKGSTVAKVQKALDKGVEVIEHSSDPVEFIKNLMAPAKIRSIRILQKENGEKIATVETDPKNKRIAIGRGGQNIERARLLARRQHNISNIIIK
ncbi:MULTISPECIES: NusA-like transcription termination signal-binding factor [Methanothermobacter]|uniref:Probable transcription termination protein NusA n=1 Tax=Methanothermobacter marburgensis (strain ATCC BAA-927 / DSM 2133 / JCM 14651 / NBRC 100331 / OCM 82 / Marburg) TaxID=79929 RepID=D9PXS5_METTM|nr:MULTISPECIES: NusA-like transcription termination signal-binding factor [Methanothermobacter]ADL59023.1 transcription termination factor [Methanothermobacter marburgensis str. Marburg]MCG2828280.1 NusA-like transcription termination signal-binding factor [Methanothermobacter sp. K4]MDI9614434.1 NusA-like transcription termination signal-binding factor [Methanothermobacter sp.]WBF09554.1 NusA-like transcription termination signal-binding factor [Methanothermobacter marburgensis]